MLALTLAALLVASPMTAPQDPGRPAAAPPGQPVDLGDVEVTGRSLSSTIDSFVNEVAAPNRGRGIARWSDRICVGVANLKGEAAQYIVDRVSTVAEDVGLTPGEPGCTPNVMIVASDDPSGLAAQLIGTSPRAFRIGGSGMDRGGAALRAFAASDAPVRWWQVAMPINSDTGERAVRIPGECRGSCGSIFDYAPVIDVFAASRINSQVVDTLFRTIVIMDIEKITDVSILQLADYLAMVTLAQIDPEADTSRYASILNVFESPEAAPNLTGWDTAYLKGLYDAERRRRNQRAGVSEITASIHRAHSELRADEAD